MNQKKAELGYVDGTAPKGLSKELKKSIPSEQDFITAFYNKYKGSITINHVDEHKPLDQAMTDITYNI